MENYLLMLYVTLSQENAIKDLFQQRGWLFHKTDIQSLERDKSVHAFLSSSIILQKSCSETQFNDLQQLSSFHPDGSQSKRCQSIKTNDYSQNETSTNMQNEDQNNLDITEFKQNNEESNQDFLEHFQSLCDNTTHIKDDIVEALNTQNADQSSLHVQHDVMSSQGERILTNQETWESHVIHEENSPSNDRNLLEDIKTKYRDSKSDLKLKIKKGKKAFLNKKRKRQEEQNKRKKGIKLVKNKINDLNIEENITVHKKQPIHCKDCDMTFTSLKRYEGHKAKNGGQCVFPCEYCDKVFKYRKSKYLLHIRSAHTKERPHVCQICGKGFVASDKLKIHIRMHTGEKPCVCEQCGKPFYSRAELSIHKEYHHLSLENQEEMRCDVCGVTFCSKRYLTYHKNVTHSEQRDFLCNKCEKRFKCNSALQRHLKYMHTENRDFVCEICDKSFKTPACLRKHNVRHGGDRNYLCSYCDKAFYEKAKLLQHERIHTGEKPYKCDLCDYRCALSGNLSKHKKTHSRV